MTEAVMATDTSNKLANWRAGTVISWIAQIVVALILVQTLVFKFTYAPQTQEIFKDMGGRPMATLVGVVELVAVVLLLWPRFSAVGAIIALGTISGAIFSHLTILGFSVLDPETGEYDGGLLFGLAITVAIGTMVVLAFRWPDLLKLVRR
jgi:uncharacterized membrane protein YphA (DoxX/SURF4 family)